MIVLTTLEPYADEQGNQIIYTGEPCSHKIRITFAGRNNVLVVAPNAKIVELGVDFAGDGAIVEILPTTKSRAGVRFGMRVGTESAVRIGQNVGSEGRTMVTAIEGAEVVLGDDCMLAMGIEIRTDDAHPIYDVRTGRRLNMAQSVHIGEHVWIAKFATIMGGVTIGAGAIVGFRSIVTRDVPNNSIAAGAPARIVRRDIAWERPMVTARRAEDVHPYPGEKNEQYWNLTEEPDEEPTPRTDVIERPVPLEPDVLVERIASLPKRSPSALASTRRSLARSLRRRGGHWLRRLESR